MPEAEATTTASAVGKSGRGKWVVAVLALVAAVAALAVWLLRSGDSGKKPKPPAGPKIKAVLHLDTFVLNLADPNEKSYLRIGIDLGLGREMKAKEGAGEPPVALVRDTVLGVLAVCRPGELLTPEGKAKLKEDLRRALRQRAPELEVEEVYFTEFLLQR